MNVIFYNKSFEKLYTTDMIESIIITAKYQDTFEFELYLPASSWFLKHDIKLGNYIKVQEFYFDVDFINTNQCFFIVRKIEYEYSNEKGLYLILQGEGLTSLLKQRIIYPTLNLNSTIINNIQSIFNDFLLGNNFSIELYMLTQIASSPTLKRQVTWDSHYEAIKSFCEYANFGFCIVVSESETYVDDNLYYLYVYEGKDHSLEQTENEHIVFSMQKGNVISFKQSKDNYDFYNGVVVAGTGEGPNRRVQIVINDSAAFDMTEDAFFGYLNDSQIDLVDPDDDLAEGFALSGDGETFLAEHKLKDIIEVEIDPNSIELYKLNLGDIVSFVDFFHNTHKARVSEIAYKWDNSGYLKQPKFDFID